MKLVKNWKRCWRWFSMQAMVLAGVLNAAWLSMPPNLISYLPPEVVVGVSLTLLVLGVVGRLIKQDEDAEG